MMKPTYLIAILTATAVAVFTLHAQDNENQPKGPSQGGPGKGAAGGKGGPGKGGSNMSGPGKGGSRGGGGSMMKFMPVLAALDADGDGTISEAELENATAALKTLDKNEDGVLTEDEVRPSFGGMSRGGPGGAGSAEGQGPGRPGAGGKGGMSKGCLLYTSDAADD